MAGSELTGEDGRMAVLKKAQYIIILLPTTSPEIMDAEKTRGQGEKKKAVRAGLVGPAMPGGAFSSCFNPVGFDISATNSEDNRFI